MTTVNVRPPLYGAECRKDKMEVGGTFSFYHFMESHLDDNTPIGDLARDMYSDCDFPKHATRYRTISEYLHSCNACDGAMAAFAEAYSEYSHATLVRMLVRVNEQKYRRGYNEPYDIDEIAQGSGIKNTERPYKRTMYHPKKHTKRKTP